MEPTLDTEEELEVAPLEEPKPPTKEELEHLANLKKLEKLEELHCRMSTRRDEKTFQLMPYGKPTYHIVSGLATVHCYGCGTTLIQRSHNTDRVKMLIEAYEMHKEAHGRTDKDANGNTYPQPVSRGPFYNRLQK